MTAPLETFIASFEGNEAHTFSTIQEAMSFAETLDAPTGFIDYSGSHVFVYTKGDVELGPAGMVDGPYPEGEEWP